MKKLIILLALFFLALNVNASTFQVIYDDLTLGNHTLCVFQRTNYTDNATNISGIRDNIIECVSVKNTYVPSSISFKLLENVSYIVTVERRKKDFLATPGKLESGLFKNIGLFILLILLFILLIAIYRRIKK